MSREGRWSSLKDEYVLDDKQEFLKRIVGLQKLLESVWLWKECMCGSSLPSWFDLVEEKRDQVVHKVWELHTFSHLQGIQHVNTDYIWLMCFIHTL